MGRRSNAQIAAAEAVAVTQDALVTATLTFVDNCVFRAPGIFFDMGHPSQTEWSGIRDAAIAFRSALEAKARAHNVRESSAAPRV